MSSVNNQASDAPPALFLHCVAAYEAMLNQAHYLNTDELCAGGAGYSTRQDILIYEGFLTQLVQKDLSLSVPYYTSIRKSLIDMGCIRQLKRGGGTAPSQWELIYEPTFEAFESATPSKIPKQTKEEATMQQIQALSNRIGVLEKQFEEIVQLLQKTYGTEE